MSCPWLQQTVDRQCHALLNCICIGISTKHVGNYMISQLFPNFFYQQQKFQHSKNCHDSNWVPLDLNVSTLPVLTERPGAHSWRDQNDLSEKGCHPSVRTCNLAQFCDSGYQLSALTELLPITMARVEKAQLLIANQRVVGSNYDLGKLRRGIVIQSLHTGCVIHAESIGKLW